MSKNKGEIKRDLATSMPLTASIERFQGAIADHNAMLFGRETSEETTMSCNVMDMGGAAINVELSDLSTMVDMEAGNHHQSVRRAKAMAEFLKSNAEKFTAGMVHLQECKNYPDQFTTLYKNSGHRKKGDLVTVFDADKYTCLDDQQMEINRILEAVITRICGPEDFKTASSFLPLTFRNKETGNVFIDINLHPPGHFKKEIIQKIVQELSAELRQAYPQADKIRFVGDFNQPTMSTENKLMDTATAAGLPNSRTAGNEYTSLDAMYVSSSQGFQQEKAERLHFAEAGVLLDDTPVDHKNTKSVAVMFPDEHPLPTNIKADALKVALRNATGESSLDIEVFKSARTNEVTKVVIVTNKPSELLAKRGLVYTIEKNIESHHHDRCHYSIDLKKNPQAGVDLLNHLYLAPAIHADKAAKIEDDEVRLFREAVDSVNDNVKSILSGKIDTLKLTSGRAKQLRESLQQIRENPHFANVFSTTEISPQSCCNAIYDLSQSLELLDSMNPLGEEFYQSHLEQIRAGHGFVSAADKLQIIAMLRAFPIQQDVVRNVFDNLSFNQRLSFLAQYSKYERDVINVLSLGDGNPVDAVKLLLADIEKISRGETSDIEKSSAIVNELSLVHKVLFEFAGLQEVPQLSQEQQQAILKFNTMRELANTTPELRGIREKLKSTIKNIATSGNLSPEIERCLDEWNNNISYFTALARILTYCDSSELNNQVYVAIFSGNQEPFSGVFTAENNAALQNFTAVGLVLADALPQFVKDSVKASRGSLKTLCDNEYIAGMAKIAKLIKKLQRLGLDDKSEVLKKYAASLSDAEALEAFATLCSDMTRPQVTKDQIEEALAGNDLTAKLTMLTQYGNDTNAFLASLDDLKRRAGREEAVSHSDSIAKRAADSKSALDRLQSPAEPPEFYATLDVCTRFISSAKKLARVSKHKNGKFSEIPNAFLADLLDQPAERIDANFLENFITVQEAFESKIPAFIYKAKLENPERLLQSNDAFKAQISQLAIIAKLVKRYSRLNLFKDQRDTAAEQLYERLANVSNAGELKQLADECGTIAKQSNTEIESALRNKSTMLDYIRPMLSELRCSKADRSSVINRVSDLIVKNNLVLAYQTLFKADFKKSTIGRKHSAAKAFFRSCGDLAPLQAAQAAVQNYIDDLASAIKDKINKLSDSKSSFKISHVDSLMNKETDVNKVYKDALGARTKLSSKEKSIFQMLEKLDFLTHSLSNAVEKCPRDGNGLVSIRSFYDEKHGSPSIRDCVSRHSNQHKRHGLLKRTKTKGDKLFTDLFKKAKQVKIQATQPESESTKSAAKSANNPHNIPITQKPKDAQPADPLIEEESDYDVRRPLSSGPK